MSAELQMNEGLSHIDFYELFTVFIIIFYRYIIINKIIILIGGKQWTISRAKARSCRKS